MGFLDTFFDSIAAKIIMSFVIINWIITLPIQISKLWERLTDKPKIRVEAALYNRTYNNDTMLRIACTNVGKNPVVLYRVGGDYTGNHGGGNGRDYGTAALGHGGSDPAQPALRHSPIPL